MSTEKEYVAGLINIGKEEIRVRKRIGHIGIILTLILASIIFGLSLDRIWRLTLTLPIATAMVGYLQAKTHFCMFYAFAGKYNFDEAGNAKPITDPTHKSRDLRKGLKLVIISLLIGLTVSVIAFILPF